MGGALSAIFGTVNYAVGGTGVLAALNTMNPAGIDKGFIGYIVSSLVAFVLGFGLTYILRDKSELKEDNPERISA